MQKATKQLISEVLRKRIADCSKEELSAILKLVGFTVKEYSATQINSKEDDRLGVQRKSVYFEIHHRYFYCMGIQAESLVKICNYHNEYLQKNGYAIPTENVGELIQFMLNMWVPKFPFEFEGPEYNERIDVEYDSIEELQELLGHLQQEMTAMFDLKEPPSMDLDLEMDDEMKED